MLAFFRRLLGHLFSRSTLTSFLDHDLSHDRFREQDDPKPIYITGSPSLGDIRDYRKLFNYYLESQYALEWKDAEHHRSVDP